MVRTRIKSTIGEQSTGGKVVIVLGAVVAMVIARQGAFFLEGAGDVAIVLVGLPVLLLFFSGLYVGVMALIALYNDTTGT